MISAFDFLQKFLGGKYDSTQDKRKFYYRTANYPDIKRVDYLDLSSHHALYATRERDSRELIMDANLLKRFHVSSVGFRSAGLMKRGILISFGGV